MSLQEEITTAIAAHGLWKSGLRNAVETGRSYVAPAAVRADNLCKFGQWLYGATITDSVKASPAYQECRDLHAKFHAAAAHVLDLALAGRSDQAEAALRDGSEFAMASHALTTAMLRWKNTAG